MYLHLVGSSCYTDFMKKVPLTIITGFLGSGKTTLLNKILKQNEDLKIGILLNEFGDVALESQFLVKTDEEVVELPNGCVCCVARGELIDGLNKIMEFKPETEYIILEASGLSDPLSLMLTFYNPLFRSNFRLDTIVGVVDYLNFENVMDIYDIARHQVHFSNIVVISKSKKEDNLDQIKELITELNPKAIIYQDTDEFDSTVLLDKILLDPAEVDKIKEEYQNSQENSQGHKHNEKPHYSDGPKDNVKNDHDDMHQDEHEHEHEDHHDHEHEPHVHEAVDHVFFETNKPMDHKKLDNFVENLPANVVRAKGFANFANAPIENKKYLLQYVVGRKDWFRTDWDREKSTGILIIGKDLDESLLLKELEACIYRV